MKPYLILLFLCLPLCSSADDMQRVDEVHEFVVIPATRKIGRELREGGFVLFMRHGKTDTSHPDKTPRINLNDCSTQRPLSDEGKRESARIGKLLRKARIPISEIHASPLCRAQDTALAAFGSGFSTSQRLMYFTGMTDKERFEMIETTRELLSRPVTEHSNRVVVAHTQNLMEVMSYLPQPEGVTVILKPMGDNRFKYIATVLPDQWRQILPIAHSQAQE